MARRTNAVSAVLVFATFVVEPACLAQGKALDALAVEAGAGAAIRRITACRTVLHARRADVVDAIPRAAAWVLEIARVTHLPAGDAGTFEAICRAALEQVVARHAVPAAPEADAPEAVLMAALAICRAGRTLFKAGTADTVGAIADATLRVVGTGSADRQAGCAYAGDARLATALLVRHACCAVHLARRELDAGQVHVVALVARAAVDIDLATRRVRALGAGSLPAQPERAEASGEELEHAATRGAGADQSGEVVKALAVHSRKTPPRVPGRSTVWLWDRRCSNVPADRYPESGGSARN